MKITLFILIIKNIILINLVGNQQNTENLKFTKIKNTHCSKMRNGLKSYNQYAIFIFIKIDI